MKMPPIHELHERLKRRPTDRSEPPKPITQEFEVPVDLDAPEWGPSRGNKYTPKTDETQPIPIYSE